MTLEKPTSVLEMKAFAQRHGSDANDVLVSRALRRALAIAADTLWGTSLNAPGAPEISCDTNTALKQLSASHLLIRLDCPHGDVALVALDAEMVTALIEVQTVGKVTQMTFPERAFTNTDFALVTPWLDAALPRFASMLTGHEEADAFQGYTCTERVEDVTAANIALTSDRMRTIVLELDIAQGARTGMAAFLFPESLPSKKTVSQSLGDGVGKHADVLELVPTRLKAVLATIHLPLEKAQALQVGDTLPISNTAVGMASMVVDGGHTAARGKLGQINGFRAFRIGEERTLHQPSAMAPAQHPLEAAAFDPASPVDPMDGPLSEG